MSGLIRNMPCTCGSGLKYKKCCRKADEADPASSHPGLGVYLVFEDLWGRKATWEDVRGPLRGWSREDLILRLAKINLLLHAETNSPGWKKQLRVLRPYLSESLAIRIQRWLEPGKRNHAFHRLLLLASIRFVAIDDALDSNGAPLAGHEQRLGESVLALTDLLERAAPGGQPAGDDDSGPFGVLFRAGYLAEAENFGSAIGRTWFILTDGFAAVGRASPKLAFDFRAEFRRRLGCQLEEVVGLGIALHGRYSKLAGVELPPDPQDVLLRKSYFEKTKLGPEALKAALGFLSATVVELSDRIRARAKEALKPILDLRAIFERPVLETRDGGFCPLDDRYLNARMIDGPYWELSDHIRAEEGNAAADRLRDIAGGATEFYVGRLLRDTELRSAERSVWLDWDGEMEAPEGVKLPDAVVKEGETIFVLEVTASGVIPSVAMSGDSKRVRSALEALWFGRGPNKESAKLAQLQAAADACRHGHLTIKGLALTDIRRVVPVLVTLRPLPHVEGLTQWYRTIMLGNGLPQSFIDELVTWDLDELEQLCAARLEGQLWRELITAKLGSAYASDSWNNWLYYERPGGKRPPFVNELIEETFRVVRMSLFGTPGPHS